MTITETDRQINLASASSSPLSKARLQQEILRLGVSGMAATEVADKLKIPSSHVGAIFTQNGLAKPTPTPGKPYRLPPAASQVDNTAHYADSMIKSGYDPEEIASHVKVALPELRRRIAAAGL